MSSFSHQGKLCNTVLYPCNSPQASHRFLVLFQIAVKSKYWMEKMSTTNYCQLWSQSLRKSTRPPPPPTLSSGPLVSQSWALQPCQPVRQMHQTFRQTLQRTCSVLDVQWYVEQVSAVQNRRPVQAMPSAVNPTVFYKHCAIFSSKSWLFFFSDQVL